jgi:lipoprotein-anchoring transpeptidase ErfK/SrfK
VVTSAANVYEIPLGDGLYDEEGSRVTFRIGDAHVSVADDQTKQISVYNNGMLVRTMPTSMGMGGAETIGGQTISFWTQRVTYTAMDKANPVIRDSSTFGLAINSQLGYRETINYATRISTDGVYLHELDATVWAQGKTNVTHGCLNINSFWSMAQARVVITDWKHDFNHHRRTQPWAPTATRYAAPVPTDERLWFAVDQFHVVRSG